MDRNDYTTILVRCKKHNSSFTLDYTKANLDKVNEIYMRLNCIEESNGLFIYSFGNDPNKLKDICCCDEVMKLQ